MRALLRAHFMNGYFGDPALYIWQINAKNAVLVDCGDLSRLAPRQLLKVTHIFVSHCHMDHFFGFDLFLRVQMGHQKSVVIVGPTDTIERVNGKLRGYTWNLIRDQNIQFVVEELRDDEKKKKTAVFSSVHGFEASSSQASSWQSGDVVYDNGFFQGRALTIDHRTPSLAYTIEEKLSVGVNADVLTELGFKKGPWINELKELFLANKLKAKAVDVPLEDGSVKSFEALALVTRLFTPRQRQKIAYVTDGAASNANRAKLLPFVASADALFHETCFMAKDQRLADETKHFTAEFVGRLAAEAQVKKLIPFHFSKRYLGCEDQVFSELAQNFSGEITRLQS